jgi:hypothetical protein
LRLKFLQHKPEVAGPMPQHTQHYSYPDVDAYTVRIQARDVKQQYQIISISNDNNIKILTLNQSFVNEFTQKKIAALAEPSIELVDDIDKALLAS